MPNSRTPRRVIVEDFAVELASLLADYSSRQWEAHFADDSMWEIVDKVLDKAAHSAWLSGEKVARRIVATTLYVVGHPSAGLPGVIPYILKMLGDGEISVRSIRNDLSPLQLSDVSANLAGWYMESADAERLRERLLPEGLRSKINEKAEKGRYTIEEAISFIESPIELIEDEADFYDRDIGGKLRAAVMSGALPVYWPGKNTRYVYDPSSYFGIREYFEEAYWYDLNKWLADELPKVNLSFPNPEALPSEHQANKAKLNGVPKHVILSVEWPLPTNAPTLQNTLDNLPKWVEPACIKVGKVGKGAEGSHLWNPAILAICLNTKTSHKNWIVKSERLTNILRVSFPEYLEQWEARLE